MLPVYRDAAGIISDRQFRLNIGGNMRITKLSLCLLAALTMSAQQMEVAGDLRPRAASSGAPAVNPMQLALLKWFPAYQSAASFPVFSVPQGVVFDGSSIWVASIGTTGTGTLNKLRASDGASLGMFTELSAVSLAFDGINIWAAVIPADQVLKVRASDGTIQGVIYAGNGPVAAMATMSGLRTITTALSLARWQTIRKS